MARSSRERSIVLVVNPPQWAGLDEDVRIAFPEEHADWANYPCLGALTLASAVSRIPGVSAVYVDGVVISLAEILRFLERHHADILAVAVSLLSSNYGSALEILGRAKELDPRIVTIVGNDHFTALHRNVLRRRRGIIDYGFRGNEVVEPFCRLVADLKGGHDPKDHLERYGGLALLLDERVVEIPALEEPVFAGIDYGLIDRHFVHSPVYARNLARSIGAAPEARRSGMTVELARGCIKFRGDNACTFCSIQYGSQWKNSLPARAAREVLERAHAAGYTDLYLTADELPLTFPALLKDLSAGALPWKEGEGGSMSAYARADGLALGDRAEMMKAIGIDLVRVGVDACPEESLVALNKPLRPGDALAEANYRAVDRARSSGLKMKLSFVVGHFGQTPELLARSTAMANEFIAYAAEVVHSVDVEVLSPEPGSRDFAFLADPRAATSYAERLGVAIAPPEVRARVAEEWAERDGIDSGAAAADYARLLMPGVRPADLLAARASIRNAATAHGVMVGGGELPGG